MINAIISVLEASWPLQYLFVSRPFDLSPSFVKHIFPCSSIRRSVQTLLQVLPRGQIISTCSLLFKAVQRRPGATPAPTCPMGPPRLSLLRCLHSQMGTVGRMRGVGLLRGSPLLRGWSLGTAQGQRHTSGHQGNHALQHHLSPLRAALRTAHHTRAPAALLIRELHRIILTL